MRPSRLFRAGCVLFVGLLLAACSSPKPEAAVEAFYQAAAKKNVDRAAEQVALGDVPDNEMLMVKGMLQMMIGAYAAKIESNDGLKRIEVLETTVDEDGQSARVRSKLLFNNGKDETVSDRLHLEGGKWKIAFK